MLNPIKLFLAAVAFLTRFPVPRWAHPDERTLGASMSLFPAVGALLGGVNAAAAYALMPLAPRDVTATALVALPVVMTGALHYDGLADTVDALGGGFTRERRLAIMKDPHIGTYGVIALVVLLLLQFSVFRAARAEDLYCALIVAPTLARTPGVMLAYFCPYARAEGGKGKAFVENLRPAHVLVAVVIAVGVSWTCVGGARAAAALAMTAAICAVAGAYFRRHLGGVTGDALGATSQTCEAAILLMLCWRVG